MYDRSNGGIPIYIAAGGPVMAKCVGRQGDGFICTSGKGMELYTENLLPAVAEGVQLNDRNPDAIDRTIEMRLSLDPDPQQAGEHPVLGPDVADPARQRITTYGPVA